MKNPFLDVERRMLGDVYTSSAAMDNLTVNEVPEPGTWVAAALLLAAIAFSQRDRLSRAKPIGR